MSSTAESPEAKELNLLSKVELRIALADTDQKLGILLNTYLAPVLLKLASEHLSVRNKVISICQHISARIKAPTIKLPVAALLKQFKDFPDVLLIRHFDLLYVQQGLGRLSSTERADLMHDLIKGISSETTKSTANGSILFNLILRTLHDFKLPERGSLEDDKLGEKFGLDQRAEDASFLTSWFGKLLLLNVNRTIAGFNPASCPGISRGDFEFLTLSRADTWDPTQPAGLNLIEIKVLVGRYLSSGLFNDSERFLPALFASTDNNSNLAELGDDMLKRSIRSIDLEDQKMVKELFAVYFGDTASGLSPAKTAIRTKILSYLSKSVTATTFTDDIFKMVEEGFSSSENSETVGREKLKFQRAILSIMNWISRMGSLSGLQKIAPRLLHTLRDYIESQGWPFPNPDADLSLRGQAYEIIGLLAKAVPKEVLADPNLDLIRWLFTSYISETSESGVSLSVDESLTSVLQAISSDIRPEIEDPLLSLLTQHMGLDVGDESPAGSPAKVLRSSRFPAVRFANCFPYENVIARWIDILAVGQLQTERSEVVEEGRKGLHPYWYGTLNQQNKKPVVSGTLKPPAPHFRFPKFPDLVRSVLHVPDPMDTTEVGSIVPLREIKRDHVGVYAAAVGYCRQVLLSQALIGTVWLRELGPDWEQRLDAVSNDSVARQEVKEYLKEHFSAGSENHQALVTFLQVCLNGLPWKQGEGIDQCGESLQEILAFADNYTIAQITRVAPSLRQAIFSNKAHSRLIGARIFGIMLSHSSIAGDQIEMLSRDLLAKVKSWPHCIGAELNMCHGAVLALGFLVSRLAIRGRTAVIKREWAQDFIDLNLDLVARTKDVQLQTAGLIAIDQLSIFFVLSPDRLSPEVAQSTFKSLAKKSQTGSEKAILTLGRFGMLFLNEEVEDSPMSTQILNQLYELHELKQPEIQFAVGESMSCLVAGWNSQSLETALDVDVPLPKTKLRTSLLEETLNRILQHCKETKPSLRRAACIWLLCFVRFCGHLEQFQPYLLSCQHAFKGFLTDKDELIQESASRGLALVYGKGDRTLKDDLVRDLLSSLTGSRSTLSGKVDEETKLFDPGALPTGDGSISTYKDIMSLASEVGDPSLVYRFMGLASNNAIWLNRTVIGQFGLANILSESGVDEYLAQDPKLYSKLFRYRFDPNAKVRRSMNQIWNALVKDSAAIIDKHFDHIMEDLLDSMLGKEWRARQASCVALADLLQGQRLERYEKYLERLWATTFKVLDDIKDSVRVSAMDLCRVLTTSLVHIVEADESRRRSSTMLQHIMPFLLSPAGLEATAQDVQLFALDTILKLTRTGKPPLRPYIPDLVEKLLSLLSSIEPEAINYLHLNAAKYGLTEEKIDAARLQSVRSSPMMDAIERCLDVLDEEGMKVFVPRLANAIKQAVGTPTKVGCSRVIVSLCTQHRFLSGPYIEALEKAVFFAMYDRNLTVSSSYTTAAGYLARVAPRPFLVRLINAAMVAFFDKEGDRPREISGECVLAISKYAPDKFSEMATQLVPFVFVAKHDTSVHVRELFQQVWENSVGGTRAILLYFQEILKLATSHLTSPKWAVKHSTALTIADIAKTPDLSPEQQEKLWPALRDALNGKTWEGKELVLEAFGEFAKRVLESREHEGIIGEQMREVVLRESKRRNALYRQHALPVLGMFAEAYPGDISDDVLKIVTDFIEEASDNADSMDVDASKDGPSSKTVEERTMTHAAKCIFQCINPRFISYDELLARLSEGLELAERAKATAPSPTLASLRAGVKLLCKRLQESTAPTSSGNQLEDTLARCVKLISPLSEGKTIGERQDAADAASELTRLLGAIADKSTARLSATAALLKEETMKALEAEPDRSVKTLLEAVLARLKP